MSSSVVNTPAALGAVATASIRRGGVDAVRLLSVFGVVWHHASMPLSSIGQTGVLALTALSVAFTPRPTTPRAMREKTIQRISRLLFPWLLWSFVFAALKAVTAVAEGGAPFAWFTPDMLLAGTWIHLWFLPFLFAVNVGLMGVSLAAGKRTIQAEVVLGIALVAVSGLWYTLALPVPFHQWGYFMPGVAMGVWIRVQRSRPHSAWSLSAVAITPAVAGMLAWLSAGHVHGLEVGIGLALAALAWVLPWQSPRTILKLGALAMGVYLVHPIFIVGLRRVVTGQSDAAQVIVFGGSLVLSVLAAAVISKLFPRALGE